MDFQALLAMLPYMGIGMLGIFVVVLIMIACVYGLTICTAMIEKKKKS